MRKNTDQQIQNRRNEIMNACRKIYNDYEFEEISMKMISEITSLSRPSIYNYFQTKEEIFFAILIDEYQKWNAFLMGYTEEQDCQQFIMDSLQDREIMLKLQCLNLYQIEENSREEFLIQYKEEFFASRKNISSILETRYTASQIHCFLEIFFPYLYGIYAYIHPTRKQADAIQQVHQEFEYIPLSQRIKECMKQLLDQEEL